MPLSAGLRGASVEPASPGPSKAAQDLLHARFLDYGARWAFIIAAGVLSLTALNALGVAMNFDSLLTKVKFPLMTVAFGLFYGAIGRRVSGLAYSAGVVSDLCLSFSQFMIAVVAMLPLTYLAVAPGFPLVDGTLSHLDTLLFSFEWDAAARWVANRPLLDWLLGLAYGSFYWQAFLLLLLGSISRPGDRNGELIWHFCISLSLTCAIFVFTPALGKVGHAGTGYISVIMEIRAGLWRVFDYNQADGIITFPSFHAALAVILAYAARRQPWALVIFLPANVLMLASTPTIGGHYLVDLPGGVLVALASILLTRVWRRW